MKQYFVLVWEQAINRAWKYKFSAELWILSFDREQPVPAKS